MPHGANVPLAAREPWAVTGGRTTTRYTRRNPFASPAPPITGAGNTYIGDASGMWRALTPAEAAHLQTFPADHPWRGTKTKTFQQIGNAVPPLLAQAILRATATSRSSAMPDTFDAVDLFAGPGGWDVAAHSLGLNVLGIEWDHAACETRRAADLPTIEGDVREYGPALFPDVKGFIASPPCQTFSAAGKGAGRAALDVVLAGIKALEARQPLVGEFSDERTALVLEPLRWALEAIDLGTAYEWLCFEQVPTVLPVWQAMADVLRREGYSVATGNLQAEQYGVPQTRKRAVLVARLYGEAQLPTPTHSRYYSREPKRLDEGVLPWISMAEALGWTGTDLVGFPRRSDGAEEIILDGTAYRARDLRAAEAPSFVVTEKACSWQRWTHMGDVYNSHGSVRPVTEPAPTLTSSMDNGNFRFVNAAEATPKLEARLGVTATKPPSTGVRVSAAEAARLQTFPLGYPWQGTSTKVFQQIGNAVPPLLAAAVLNAARGE